MEGLLKDGVMKRKTAKTNNGERRKKTQRVTTDRRRDKSRWDVHKPDRRKDFGRRKEDKAWEKLVDKLD